MKWYDGDIAEAINISKLKGAVFVVYLEGTDEKSQKITDLIDNGGLGQLLEQEHFVAIKVPAGSTAHGQFGQIYKEPTVPSIYFIGKNGVPLDIITGSNNLNDASSRIDSILMRAGISEPPLQSVSASVLTDNFIKHEQSGSDSPKVIAESPEVAESLEVTESPKVVAESPEVNTESPKVNAKSLKDEDESPKVNVESPEVKAESPKVICDNNVCTVVDEKNDGGEPNQVKKDEGSSKEVKDSEENEDLSSDLKLQRAKALIELKNKQKQQEEQENERLKEIERRKMGQSVQQLKKWQDDQELKQLKEERDKEKRENQLARERVLAQIAQDRVERQSRCQAASPPIVNPKTQSSPPKPPSNTTRLHFKLPDGSSLIQEFRNSDTLECVFAFLRTDLHITLSSFTLATTFPKREYTEKDYPTSLLDLQLVPTAVILVLPTNDGAVNTNTEGGFISAIIWGLIAPIFTMFGYIKRFVFGSSTSRPRNTRRPPNEPATSISKGQTIKSGEPSTVRRRENIHRLSSLNDSDDENNTWNGNSTQQM